MSTTTRTAAATKIYIWNGVKHIFVDAAVCEQFEDELAAVTAERDALKHALIELESASEAYAADQSRATDSRCGLVQPITVEDGNRLLSALKIANELTK
jgi:hypothetical protein